MENEPLPKPKRFGIAVINDWTTMQRQRSGGQTQTAKRSWMGVVVEAGVGAGTWRPLMIALSTRRLPRGPFEARASLVTE